MSKYYRLKKYIKCNFRTLPISNKIMIIKWRTNYFLHILKHCFSIFIFYQFELYKINNIFIFMSNSNTYNFIIYMILIDVGVILK